MSVLDSWQPCPVSADARRRFRMPSLGGPWIKASRPTRCSGEHLQNTFRAPRAGSSRKGVPQVFWGTPGRLTCAFLQCLSGGLQRGRPLPCRHPQRFKGTPMPAIIRAIDVGHKNVKWVVDTDAEIACRVFPACAPLATSQGLSEAFSGQTADGPGRRQRADLRSRAGRVGRARRRAKPQHG